MSDKEILDAVGAVIKQTNQRVAEVEKLAKENDPNAVYKSVAMQKIKLMRFELSEYLSGGSQKSVVIEQAGDTSPWLP